MSDKISNDEAVVADNNGNPDEVEAIAAKFKGFEFLSSGVKMFGGIGVTYPPEVERRLKALKKLQVEMFNIESKFFEELHEMETKYASLYAKNWSKRNEIIAGKYEPTEEECDFKIVGAEEENKNEDAEDKKNVKSESPVLGIPKFWLTIFQNVGQFSDLIEERDTPILEHLEDISMELIKEPMGFKLFFHFSPNDYFSNSVLTKTYDMRIQVDPKDPFSFEGTEIYKSTGCKIDWKEGKNVTVREVKKKQKHKSTGAIRVTSKIVPSPSFFDFFSPPQIDENDDNVDQEVQEKVTVDFEVGSFLKERLIPRAVLYFTGEALESDDEDEEEEGFTDEDTDGDGSGNDQHNEEDSSASENEGDKE